MVTTAASLAPAASAQAMLTPTTVSLNATEDAGTIKSQPTFSAPNAYFVLNRRPNGDFDHNFVKFDLASLPANATITAAALHLNIHAAPAAGSLNVEAGRANSAWNEATLSWNNQPAVTWGGPVTTITGVGDARWPVTSVVQAWHTGTMPNHGFVLRGTNGSGAGVRADTAEWGQVDPKLVITYTTPDRSRDLGDAPDSTNHPNVPMSAYAGVQANFPTVFDPATGAPSGPAHLDPLPFHLGPQVSREADADVGPDDDPTNNIRPAANQPNLDRYDDGALPNTWNLAHCQRVNVPVQVFISPQAVTKFQQQGTPAYLNVWLDSNRDGDWADGFPCQNSHGQNHGAVEHMVIDAPVNVVALGQGLHTIQRLSGYIAWPAALAQKPSWVRVTLSERPSNKTLQLGTIKYGDGRGYPTPFNTGETEDYLRTP
jgi:hypothetical protein